MVRDLCKNNWLLVIGYCQIHDNWLLIFGFGFPDLLLVFGYSYWLLGFFVFFHLLSPS